jgi:CheY-like chemotaxis protein
VARILIADDEESMRLLVGRAIAMDGHEIVTAEDGAEALEILTEQGGAFDLLLTDIKMPVMDGIALALAVGTRFPRPDDPADDRLRRPARTRDRPECDRARRGDEAVFGGGYPHGRGRRTGGEEQGIEGSFLSLPQAAEPRSGEGGWPKARRVGSRPT